MIITRLQTSLQKHHKTLLACLLVVIIASFVFYMGPSSGSRGGDVTRMHRGIDLADLRSSRDARDLAAFSLISYGRTLHTEDFLHIARTARTDGSGDRETGALFGFLVSTTDRLLDADALGIPMPGDKELRDFIAAHPLFKDNSGAFSPSALKALTEHARARLGLDEARLQHALGNAWRLRKLAALEAPSSAPALSVLAARLSEKDRTRWTVETASFSRADFSAKVASDDKSLADFFAANRERYRVPEKLRLRFARVPGDTKAADALPPPSDAALASFVKSRPDLFPAAAASTDFLKDNRDAALKAWRAERAGEARAVALSGTLESAMPLGSPRPDNDKVDALIKAAGLTAVKLPAYSADDLPKGTGVPDALLADALRLNSTEWRTGASFFGADAFVFIFDGSDPSRLPELAEVRARVVADHAAAETDRLFAEAASRKAVEIAAAVKAGKDFAAASTAAGFKVTPARNFERGECPDDLAAHLTALDPLAIGEVSPMLTAGRDRLVARIITKLAPDTTKDDPATAFHTAQIGSMSAALTAQGSAVK